MNLKQSRQRKSLTFGKLKGIALQQFSSVTSVQCDAKETEKRKLLDQRRKNLRHYMTPTNCQIRDTFRPIHIPDKFLPTISAVLISDKECNIDQQWHCGEGTKKTRLEWHRH